MKHKILTLFTAASLLIAAPYSVAKKPPPEDNLQQQIDELTARIDELEATSPLYLMDGNGTRIGPFVDWPLHFEPNLYVNTRTPTGYTFSIIVNSDGNEGRPVGGLLFASAWFTLPSCQGPMYISTSNDAGLTFIQQGLVVAAYNGAGNKGLYSAKSAAVSYGIGMNSFSVGPNGCTESPQTQFPFRVFLVVPNDPIETGLSVMQFEAPITIQHAADTNP